VFKDREASLCFVCSARHDPIDTLHFIFWQKLSFRNTWYAYDRVRFDFSEIGPRQYAHLLESLQPRAWIFSKRLHWLNEILEDVPQITSALPWIIAKILRVVILKGLEFLKFDEKTSKYFIVKEGRKPSQIIAGITAGAVKQ